MSSGAPPKYIAADDSDDDDIDEASLPAFAQPELESTAPTTNTNKGKGRGDDLLSGKIGSPLPTQTQHQSQGGSSRAGGTGSTRQKIGGVQVETRFGWAPSTQLTRCVETRMKLMDLGL